MPKTHKQIEREKKHRGQPNAVFISVDIRTNKGERIYKTKERKLEEVIDGLIEALRYNCNVKVEKKE